MRILLSIFLFLFPLTLSAQEFNFVFEPEAFPVEIDGWQPYCPWAGGVCESNPAIVDIDSDGDLDMFAGSFWGYVSYYENMAAAAEPSFNLITKEYAGVDLSGNIYAGRTDPCFVDINGDNDYDLFVSDDNGNFYYYQNDGSSSWPDFNLITNQWQGINFPPNAEYWRGFCFDDIDGDEGLDLFYGDLEGGIQFFCNWGDSTGVAD